MSHQRGLEIGESPASNPTKVTLGDLGELGELPHWRFMKVMLGELGELGELLHWRSNVTPRFFVAEARQQ